MTKPIQPEPQTRYALWDTSEGDYACVGHQDDELTPVVGYSLEFLIRYAAERFADLGNEKAFLELMKPGKEYAHITIIKEEVKPIPLTAEETALIVGIENGTRSAYEDQEFPADDDTDYNEEEDED